MQSHLLFEQKDQSLLSQTCSWQPLQYKKQRIRTGPQVCASDTVNGDNHPEDETYPSAASERTARDATLQQSPGNSPSHRSGKKTPGVLFPMCFLKTIREKPLYSPHWASVFSKKKENQHKCSTL